jgi:hypothetical protein
MKNKHTLAPYTCITIITVTLGANCEFIMVDVGANGCESDNGVPHHMNAWKIFQLNNLNILKIEGSLHIFLCAMKHLPLTPL